MIGFKFVGKDQDLEKALVLNFSQRYGKGLTDFKCLEDHDDDNENDG